VGNVTNLIEDETTVSPVVDTKPVEPTENKEDDDSLNYFQKLAADG